MDDIEHMNLRGLVHSEFLPWRVGRKVPRNIYAQVGTEAAVTAHNAALST